MKNLLFLGFFLLSAVPCGARTITVNWDGSGDYRTIQAAINDSNDGDVVIVADGTYTGEGNRDIDAGPGGVENIVVRSANGPQNCIIDGQGANYGFYFDRLMYDFYLPIILLEGFTITNCKTAIYLHQTWDIPDIKNCIITGNSIDNIFGDCSGIACYESSDVEITDCIITNNYGQGLTCTMYAKPTISNCTITNNTGGGFDKSGGGIGCYALARPIIKNCVISGNEADLGGGLYIVYESEPKIYNTIITGNKASSGGGLYVTDDSELSITNCTISGNTADSGGAISVVQRSLTRVINSIIWDNTADRGADIYIGGFPSLGMAVVEYSVLQSDWGGTGNIIADPCFAQPGYWADANDPNIPVEPNDPNTIFIDGDYHLQSQAGRWEPNSQTWVQDDVNSPCIDAGDPSSDWTAELWPHGKRINMGAFGGTPQASMSLSDEGNVADLNNDDSVDYKDLMRFTDDWLYQQVLLSEDLDRNGIVNFTDFAILINNWLWQQ